MHRRRRDRFAPRWRARAAAALFAGMLSPSVSMSSVCVGDCDVDGSTTIDDVLLGVGAALSAETGACAALLGEGDTALTVDALVRGVLDLRAGCEPALALFAGVYDADVVYNPIDGPQTVSALATVGTREAGGLDIYIDVSLYDWISLGAEPMGGGKLTLTGTRIDGGDVAFDITGHAKLSIDGVASQIDAEMQTEHWTGPFPIDAHLQRPTSGTPASFNGRWQILLEEGFPAQPRSSIVLPVDVGPSGRGTCGPATDESSAAELGSIEASPCRVSPEGRIHFSALYTAANPGPTNDAFVLRGKLAGDGPSAGSYQVGLFPAASVVGSWRGSKLSDSPLAR